MRARAAAVRRIGLGAGDGCEAQARCHRGRSTPNNLPALGDPEAEDFTVGTERKLGDQIMREIRRDPDYIDDPILLEYLQSVWQPLVAEARARGNITADIDPRFAWEPFLVRDPSINAFALPGGYMGVHLGLMAITATRDELASVLAHELSHITQRHIARSIASSKRQSLLGLASLVVGLLAASRSHSPDAVSAVVAGTQAATMQGPAQFLARHGARGRPGRHGRDDRRRLRARRHGRDVREARQGLAPQRQRRLSVSAQPPALDRARRRGALAPRHRADGGRRPACSSTPSPRRAPAS